jgi:PAS domain S-box-containing protein
METASPAGQPSTTPEEHRPREVEASLFRLLVDRVIDYAIFLLTPEGRVASWNAGAERVKQYSADEIIGQSFEVFYSPEARAAGVPQKLLQIARTEGRVEDEGFRYRKDGTPFWADVVITALRDDSGTLVGFAKVTRDLSDRREADEQRRISETRFRTLVDAIKDYAIFILSPEGTIETWNAGAERLKGYTANEVIGRNFELFYTPEDRLAGRPTRLLNIARREGRVEDEGFRVRKDGTTFWADVVITALHDESGALLGFAKVTRDLTERRQGEQDRARRMAAERASDRFERLQLATAALTAASRQQHVAEVLADVAVAGLGLAGDTVSLMTEDRSSLEIVAAHGFEIGGELPDAVVRSWRTSKPVFGLQAGEQSAVPLIFEQRVLGVLGIELDEERVLDVDERAFLLALAEVAAQAMDRARLFESEHQARAEAEAAVHAQDEFLSIASHELRTPVAAVKATAQLAQRAIQRGTLEPERITRHLETITRASDRLNALVEDLLDVSRLRTGQLQLRKQSLDLVGLIQETVGRHAAATTRHQIEFSPPPGPVTVTIDPLRIEQVLDNLLSNAVKYAPGGGEIVVRVDTQPELVMVSVSDPGIGLPAGQEGRIFETFGRASNAAAQQIPGLGLGLAICQQLVERHGGRIWASSPGENLGTTIAFSLPTAAHD